jgi:tetratricopeptide (TPR) repeat protein
MRRSRAVIGAAARDAGGSRPPARLDGSILVAMLRRLVVTGALLLAGAWPCHGDRPLAPDEVADRVEDAVRAGDAAALRALASSDIPDPWLVADALCGRGAHEAAAAYATAAPRPDVEALPAYVEGQRKRPTADARRKATAAVFEAHVAKDAPRVLELLIAVPAGSGDVAETRLAHVRAVSLQGVGRLPEAMLAYEEAVRTGLALGWLARAGAAAQQGGSLSWVVPDLRRGVWLAQRGLELAERRGSPAQVAGARVQAGALYDAVGDHRVALGLMEKALPFYEERGDLAGRALLIGNLGVIRAKLGDLDEALRLQEEALELARQDGDSLQLGRSLHSLGFLRHGRGELDLALALHTEAVGRFEAAGRRGDAAMALDAMGMVHRSLGDYAQALALLQRALESARGAKDQIAESRALANLAGVHVELHDTTAAVAYLEESVRLSERAGTRRSTVTSLHNLAMTLRELGEPARALSLMRRANDLRKEMGDAGEIALGDAASALILLDLGRGDEALRAAERAVEVARTAGQPETLSSAWTVLGQVRLSRAEPSDALSAFRRASQGARRTRSVAALVESRIGEARAMRALGDAAGALEAARAAHADMEILVRGHDEERAAGARRRVAGLFEEGALAAASLGRADEVLFFLEAGRAGALRETMKAGAVLRTADLPEDLRRAEETSRTAESVALARFARALAAAAPDLEALGEALDAAREGRREAARKTQRWAKARGGGALPEAFAPEEIRRALEPGDVLVVYAWLREGVMAVVARRDGAAVVRLGPSEAIQTALAAVAPQDLDVVSPASIDRARAAILGPLALRPDDRRLLVSPDGPLTHVPFPLLEPDREVALVPSGTVLALLRARTGAHGDGVLALGDPAYGAPAGGLPLARLPSSGVEARAVGDVVLLGKEATEEGLRTALLGRPRWRAVHLACHGLLDADRPLLSSLALAPGGGDDGLLVGHEILRMTVPADLVVLSGCDTGLGKTFRGEGVLGLSRAFLLAGAPRVLVSLWKVDDEATRAFMETFYARWKSGRPLPDALREARQRVRSDPRWSHPRHWASFVLWGLPG